MVRAAGIAALFAWFMLLGQTLAHAEHVTHNDLPSNHCLVCSVGGPEDDITPSADPIGVVAPLVSNRAITPDNFACPTFDKRDTSSARSPPQC